MASSMSGLVGRRREAGALVDAVDALAGGAGRFVALHGEPGIGQTRLLEELVRRAEQQGHLVLQGRGAELERELPFGVWVDALDDHVAWLGPDRLVRMLGERVGELARVLPSAPGGAAALPDERFRAHRAVAALLEGISGPRPVVVALDDLHWADGASLELLVHLLRRPPRAPVLIALAFRAGRVPPAVSAALEAADREGRLVELALEPLATGEGRALLGETLAAPVRDELLRVSGGNPVYLLQRARAGPGPARGTAEVAGVPPAVAAALGHEIAALSPGARRLAQGAAVAGDPAQLELACAAAGLAEPAALAALDELVAEDLLSPTGVARRYRFRHPLVRRAIYESAGEGWRLTAHARAAAELEARGGSLAARAHHLERCAPAGDEAAIGLLVAAGQEAATR